MNQPHPPAPSPRHQGGGANVRGLSQIVESLRLTGGIIGIIVLAAVVAMARAQEEGVTDNDVNRVAERMYCPVCENIPLDDCETIACVEWKAEIRAQLKAGRSDQAVIDSFVARFGDNVVGVPQDPVLRALTVIVPLLGTALAIAVGVFTFRRFGARRKFSVAGESALAVETSDDAYRQRLEADLRGQR